MQFERDPFVCPSALDLRLAHELDGVALGLASEFEAVLLSPLAPLGTCAVVSPTHQDKIVSSIRGSEVVSDPTNVLALETVRRLRENPAAHVRLCTVHQVVRAQRFEARAGFSQHFRLLALGEAGLALPEHGFEVGAITEHVALFWRLLDAYETCGYEFPNRKATLFVASAAKALGDRVRTRLMTALPGLAVEDAVLDSSYYQGIRVLFGATSDEGHHVPLADTGLFDWVAAFTSNRRMRYIASGLGLQLVPALFARPR
jgi:hypothetical protein